jgi:mercuric ion transport protein
MLKISRYVYSVIAWLFVVGVLTQVFLAGMVVVAVQLPWDAHITLGHSLSAPLLLMLVSMYLGRLPGSMKRLTWLLFGVYILQADVLIFLRASAPVLSAFHPVLALVDFALGLTLARRALRFVRQAQAPAGVPTGWEAPTNP